LRLVVSAWASGEESSVKFNPWAEFKLKIPYRWWPLLFDCFRRRSKLPNGKARRWILSCSQGCWPTSLPLADLLPKAGDWTQSHYKIITTELPQFEDGYTLNVLNIACNIAHGLNHTKLPLSPSHSSWVTSLRDIKNEDGY